MTIREIREKMWGKRKCRDMYWDDHYVTSPLVVKKHMLDSNDVYAYAYKYHSKISECSAIFILKVNRFTYSVEMKPRKHYNSDYFPGMALRQMNYVAAIKEIESGKWDESFLPEDHRDNGDGYGQTSTSKLLFACERVGESYHPNHNLEIFESKTGKIRCQLRNVANIIKLPISEAYEYLERFYPYEKDVINALKAIIAIEEIKR